MSVEYTRLKHPLQRLGHLSVRNGSCDLIQYHLVKSSSSIFANTCMGKLRSNFYPFVIYEKVKKSGHFWKIISGLPIISIVC